jgi:hypothetical protein
LASFLFFDGGFEGIIPFFLIFPLLAQIK